MTPEITLALVTRNQGDLLQAFLDRYHRHADPGLPLLIVNDGSTDNTCLRLEGARSKTVQCFHLKHAGITHARNEALRRCQTAWIAFTDTDCVLPAEYFRRLLELPRRFEGKAAVEGAIIAPSGPKPPFTHSVFNPKGGTFATANMAFHVPTVLALGGFDEDFATNFREDTDLALTLLEQIGPIPFWPEWKVEHPHMPRDFWASLRQAWHRHRGMLVAEARLYQKHPSTYQRVRRFPNAMTTFRHWCWHWSGLYLRECGAYLRQSHAHSLSVWARTITLCVEAAVVATWEQLCIAAFCVSHRRTLSGSSGK